MTKEEAIRKVTLCAETYHMELENKNLLFLFGDKKSPEYFETKFMARNFYHLTGVKYVNGNNSKMFYQAALDKRLSIRDIELSDDGTTEMKLSVLGQLMNIYSNAKMIADYNETKMNLFTEKLAGNVTACIGFVHEKEYYIPNTALKEDIRNLSKDSWKRVLAIFRKPVKGDKYYELCSLQKELKIEDLVIPDEVKKRICIEI